MIPKNPNWSPLPEKNIVMKRKLIEIAFIELLLLIVIPASAQEQQAHAVETAKARTEVLRPAIWVPGTVISRHDSRIAAEVAGKLISVAEVGERFRAGEVLARINDRELQLELRNTRSQKLRLQSRFDYLQRQLSRLSSLARSNSAAEAELDQLGAERDMLKQDMETASVAIDRTLYDIERTRIVAPFDGVVVERMQQPGEYLSEASEVVRLVNLDELEIRVQAPLNVARHVNAGDRVEVRGAADSIHTEVRTIVPVGDDNSRMLQLRLYLQDSDWIIGEAVRIALSNGQAVKTRTVPRDALILREGDTYLYIVDKDNRARRVQVSSAGGSGSYVAITGNVADGDTVIIRGGERLQDGALVKVVNSEIAAQ